MFRDVDHSVGKAFTQAADLFNILHQQIDQLRVKVLTRFSLYQADDIVQLPGFFVAAFAAQCIEYIGQCCDTPGNVNVFTFEALWITTAIPAFMMLAGDNRAQLQDFTFGFRQDVVTDGGMAETVLSNAPDAREGFFAVPKVVE